MPLRIDSRVGSGATNPPNALTYTDPMTEDAEAVAIRLEDEDTTERITASAHREGRVRIA